MTEAIRETYPADRNAVVLWASFLFFFFIHLLEVYVFSLNSQLDVFKDFSRLLATVKYSDALLSICCRMEEVLFNTAVGSLVINLCACNRSMVSFR